MNSFLRDVRSLSIPGEKVSRRETKRRSEGPLNYMFTLILLVH